jgi:hypothetical protein
MFKNPFTVYEGIVSEPFFGRRFRKGVEPNPRPKYALWRNPTSVTWAWLDQNTNDIVYLQDYRTDILKTVVYFFPDGLKGDDGVSNYNFKLLRCPKRP